MINQAALMQAMQESGMKKYAVAGKMGIDPRSLDNKLTGKSEFKISEAEQLSDILHLTRSQRQQIFFAEE